MTDKGVKTFHLRYTWKGETVRFNLGDAAKLPLAEARKQAVEANALLLQNPPVDPRAEKRKAELRARR